MLLQCTYDPKNAVRTSACSKLPSYERVGGQVGSWKVLLFGHRGEKSWLGLRRQPPRLNKLSSR